MLPTRVHGVTSDIDTQVYEGQALVLSSFASCQLLLLSVLPQALEACFLHPKSLVSGHSLFLGGTKSASLEHCLCLFFFAAHDRFLAEVQ